MPEPRKWLNEEEITNVFCYNFNSCLVLVQQLILVCVYNLSGMLSVNCRKLYHSDKKWISKTPYLKNLSHKVNLIGAYGFHKGWAPVSQEDQAVHGLHLNGHHVMLFPLQWPLIFFGFM